MFSAPAWVISRGLLLCSAAAIAWAVAEEYPVGANLWVGELLRAGCAANDGGWEGAGFAEGSWAAGVCVASLIEEQIYFPMQNLLKMRLRMSSLVVEPVRASRALRDS